MKKLVPILLTVLCFIGIGRAMADDTMYVLCKPGDYVNVRESPTTKSSKEGYLECGDQVKTDGETRKDGSGRRWIHITSPQFESGDSWVCSMYLQETPIEIGNCLGHVVANGRTAIRRSPGGGRIRWAKNGDEFSIIAMSSEWALTTDGYIRRDLLDVTYE